MKLELKHLAPYFPYQLKFVEGNQSAKIMTAMYKTAIACETDFSARKIENIKPILVPLKELSAYSNGIKHRGYRTDENNFLNLISDIESGRGNYDIMQMCFEEHIDVFGLIKAGLAIDINAVGGYQ